MKAMRDNSWVMFVDTIYPSNHISKKELDYADEMHLIVPAIHANSFAFWNVIRDIFLNETSVGNKNKSYRQVGYGQS